MILISPKIFDSAKPIVISSNSFRWLGLWFLNFDAVLGQRR
jgi:hypothetical protein